MYNLSNILSNLHRIWKKYLQSPKICATLYLNLIEMDGDGMSATGTGGILYISPAMTLTDPILEDIFRISSEIPDFGSIEGEWV